MSVAVQQSLMDELTELSWMFRQNAALHHGLPDAKRLPVQKIRDNESSSVSISETTSDTTAAPAVTDSPSPGLGAAQQQGSRSLLGRAAPFLIGASTLGTLGLGGLVANSLFNQPTPIVQPSGPQTKDGSLLQYLQDHGYHLPGSEAWPTK